MRLSNKQKKAVEKITGKSWDSFGEEALESYFLYTDKGIKNQLFKDTWKLNGLQNNLFDLMMAHTYHPVTVEMWKEDFKSGLLSLSDFKGSPEHYRNHAKDIYLQVSGGMVK